MKRSVLVMVSAVLCGTVSANAQTALQNPTVFPESFGMISGFRTLEDGRLLVADPLGQALAVVDFARGTADTIGGVGGGPEEYQQPDRLFALPGDSTLLIDLGNGRLTVLDPDLQFASTTPITRPGSGSTEQAVRRMAGGGERRGSGGGGRRMVRMGGPPGGGPTFVLPQGVDDQGRVYFRVMSMGGGFGQDSGYVGRWDRTTDQIDTVASFKLREMQRQETGGSNNRNVMIRPLPLSPEDDWVVGKDGRIGVVRASEYRFDWVDNRQIHSGPEVDYRPLRVRRAEQERWMEEGSGGGVSVSVSMTNGQMQTQFGRGGGGRPTRGEINQYEWPDHLPPFRSGRAQVAPDGRVWVERFGAAGDPTRFDVFDQSGRRVAEYTVGERRRIVGFGDGVVYLAARDEFDLEYLERYAIN